MTHITPDRLAGFGDELTKIRRDIHRHPETAFEEQRTSQIVADKLTAWGIEVHRGLAKTGVVGTLKGKRPGQKTIGLRADMDALHLQEKNDCDYASSVPNKMHACGHDGHTTMLLGAAKHLDLAIHHRMVGQNVDDDVKALPRRPAAHGCRPDRERREAGFALFVQGVFAQCLVFRIVSERFGDQILGDVRFALDTVDAR